MVIEQRLKENKCRDGKNGETTEEGVSVLPSPSSDYPPVTLITIMLGLELPPAYADWSKLQSF